MNEYAAYGWVSRTYLANLIIQMEQMLETDMNNMGELEKMKTNIITLIIAVKEMGGGIEHIKEKRVYMKC
eukprot:4900103-Ditylum_brightwellii.AAC.1